MMKKMDLPHEMVPIQMVADNVPALIAYWDRDLRCRYANKPYFEWFGITPENLFGRTLRDLLGEQLYALNRPFIEGALSGKTQRFERDLVRHAWGDVRHTHATYIPDQRGGEIYGFFVLVTDITERKRAELEAVEAGRRAFEASRIKTQFLANMSHEIRTPMNGLLGMLQLMLESPISEEQRQYLDAAQKSAVHLLEVIDDILDISKIESGRMEISQRPFSLHDAIREAVASQFELARRKGLKTDLTIDPEVPPSALGDAVRVRQVLLNLVSNAVKFTPSGGVSVTVDILPLAETLVRIVVADTGVGIPKEEQANIFEEFRQIDNSYGRANKGSGLGLAIARRLARKMGGDIILESDPGQGAAFVFTFHLKRGDPNAARPLAGAEKTAVPGRRIRVLLVEDDEIARLATSRMLERENCEVHAAKDGMEAVREANAGPFDLILMDIQLPGMDGFDATALIRGEEGPNRLTPIVALTSNVQTEEKDACLAAGMQSVLAKPLWLDRLRAFLETFRAGQAPAAIE